MAKQHIGVDYSFKADADLSAYQYKFVTLSATEGYVSLMNATTDKPIGTLQDKPSASGQECSVRTSGWTKCYAGEAISIGAQIGAGSDSEAKTITPGTDTTLYVVGIALSAATTDGDIFEALLYGSAHRGA